MSNVYEELRNKIGTMIFVIWPIAVLGVLMSGYIMWLDYLSTAYAYEQLPTHEVDEKYAGYVVAGLIWAAQIVFFYIFLVDTTKVWSRQVAILCAIVDIMTDTWYKMGGVMDWSLLPWALVLSVCVFTIVSELIFTIFVGFVAETFGDFLRVFSQILDNVFDGLMTLGGVKKNDHPANKSKPAKRVNFN